MTSSLRNSVRGKKLALPPPRRQSHVSLEQALLRRRSVREYTRFPLSFAAVSQLLWAAQGVTHASGYRTAPSAGALYPLEIDLVVGEVTGLAPGSYRFLPEQSVLVGLGVEDLRPQLRGAALDQPAIERAGLVLVLSAVYRRTTSKYGSRGSRYVHLEAGHAAQNVCLQAAALDLGTVVIGAFEDRLVKKLLKMEEEDPLYLIPVGRI